MMMMMMCTASPQIACLQEDRHLHGVKVTVVSNLIWKPMGHKGNAGPNPSRLRTLRPCNEADLLPVHKVPVTVQEPSTVAMNRLLNLNKINKKHYFNDLFHAFSCCIFFNWIFIASLSTYMNTPHLGSEFTRVLSKAVPFCGKVQHCIYETRFVESKVLEQLQFSSVFSVSNCETSQCQSSLEWVHCWKSLGSPAAVQRFIGKMVSKELSIHHNFRMSCLIILIWRVAKCMTLRFVIIFDMYQWRSNTLPIESSWFVHVGNCSWKISLQP